MKALLLQQECVKLAETSFVDVTIWRAPIPVAGSARAYKYRLASVHNDVCVMRYDNEAGKGDHKHLGEREVPYAFTTLDRLVEDFWADVARL